MKSPRRGRLLVLSLAVLSLAAATYAAATGAVVDSVDESGMFFWVISATLLAALLEWRVPGSRMGRILLATGVAGSVASISGEFTAPAFARSVEASEAAWEAIGSIGFFSFFWLSLGLIPLVFPTGRSLSRKWALFGWAGASALILGFPLFIFTEQVCTGTREGVDGCALFAQNPIGMPGVPHPEYDAFGGVVLALLFVSMAGGVISLVVRFMRSNGVERQQLKLLAYVVALNLLWVTFADVFWREALGNDEVSGILSEVALAMSWAAIPLAITIAITRYRLYDIDRIISRTVSYALLVGLLAVVFATGVVWVPNVLPGLDDSPVAVAASTLAVAALFNPLRGRVQTWVDRRFNRSRYDAERILESFAESLRDRIDPDGVVAGWMGVLSETMQPSGAGLWWRANQ